MMMEATPAAALEMIQPQLVLELLIVALDPPAQLGEADELGDGGRLRQRREPVLGGRAVAPWPFDQQPLFRPRCRALLIAMGGPHAQAREARAHRAPRPFAPRHRPPRRRRQGGGHLREPLGVVRPGARYPARVPAPALPAFPVPPPISPPPPP